MSEDDTLCNPLSDLYNSLLDRNLKKIEEKQKLSKGMYTDFEVTNAGQFASIGLANPPLQSGWDGNYGSALYLLDVFGDGHPRLVFLYDRRFKDRSQTSIQILNSSVAVADIMRFLPIGPIPGNDVGTSLVYMATPPDGDYTKEFFPSGLRGYFLRKWPNLENLENLNGASGPPLFLPENVNSKGPPYYVPAILSYRNAGTYSSRIFLYRRQALFILDNYTDLGFPDRQESIVVAYRFNQNKPTDLCYLRLDHSGPSVGYNSVNLHGP